LLVFLSLAQRKAKTMSIKETKESSVVDKLFEVGAHFGMIRSRRHPSTKPFLFGAKNKVEIFDLEKTKEELEKAKNFVQTLAQSGGLLFFVGGKNESQDAVREAASSIEMPYVAGRWLGGTLTNFSEIKKRIAKLEDLSLQKEKGELVKYTKKERLLIDREIEYLQEFFSGLSPMKFLPKALFVVDPRKEEIAVKEAKKIGIPVIALASSDCNIIGIDYPIPANDASKKSIAFFVREIASAYSQGKKTAPAPKEEVK
jgi:small subunit ribosomal protein S2